MKIRVSTTVTRHPGDSRVTSSNTLIADFTVLIKGGCGTGRYFPLLDLQGATNERSQAIYPALGGNAIVNWPSQLQVGSPLGAAVSPPQFSCSPSDERCHVAFTYGEIQTIHFEAATSAVIEVDRTYFGKPEDTELTQSTWVEFRGVALIPPFDQPPQIEIVILEITTDSKR